MKEALRILFKYYPDDTPLRRTLLVHSWQVARRALQVAGAHPEWGLRRDVLLRGALLHDVGIFRCNAPDIFCEGPAHYLQHGILGAQLLREEGMPELARICERHTGTGLTRDEIERRKLPLPPQDFVPETLEEQVICYADKFFSKSSLGRVKTAAQVARSLSRFGEEGVRRFLEWDGMFGF